MSGSISHAGDSTLRAFYAQLVANVLDGRMRGGNIRVRHVAFRLSADEWHHFVDQAGQVNEGNTVTIRLPAGALYDDGEEPLRFELT